MIKTYKSNTHVSINIVLPSRKNMHITFSPLSNGGSTFTTDQEELSRAIESHYNFGKLFRLQSTIDNTGGEEGGFDTEEGNCTNEINEDNGTGAHDDDTESGLKQVHVSDLASAKDYLADKFGISRTSLRSQKAILEQAIANGIEFVGLS
ncbi:MAG: hypothetical protein ACI358_01455 [Candidatus Limimorpha sp.]